MKQLSMRYFGTLAIALLFCFSCTDHSPNPAQVLPVIRTLRWDVVLATNNLDYIYNLEFESLGNVQIKEYGIVLDYAESSEDTYNTVPTVANHKVKFNTLPKIGKISQPEVGPDQVYSYQYYRAYVILADDSVIYGSDTFNFD